RTAAAAAQNLRAASPPRLAPPPLPTTPLRPASPPLPAPGPASARPAPPPAAGPLRRLSPSLGRAAGAGAEERRSQCRRGLATRLPLDTLPRVRKPPTVACGGPGEPRSARRSPRAGVPERRGGPLAPAQPVGARGPCGAAGRLPAPRSPQLPAAAAVGAQRRPRPVAAAGERRVMKKEEKRDGMVTVDERGVFFSR
ncbi:Hypothetical predicted protein, partial [Marmota monax]